MGTLNMLARSLAGMLINLLQTLMLIMALMSWIPQLRRSKIYYAISMIVEPVIDPFRRLLYKIPGMDRFPLDLSFLVAYMVLSMLAGLL